MDKVIFLHIGTSKTGTSSIQDFLYRNSSVLAEKGYCFKQMPIRYQRASKNRNALFLNRRPLTLFGTPSERLREKLLKFGLKQVKDQLEHFSSVVLTDEALWNSFLKTDCKTLKRIKAFSDENGAQLKLIVYFRPQDDWLESSYKQRIRKFRGKTILPEWDTFFNSPETWPKMDYYNGLCTMSEIVGKDNIIVRIYNRADFPEGKVENDFLQAIGLQPSGEYKMAKEEINTSLSTNYIELKRILNQLDGVGNVSLTELISAERAAVECSKKFNTLDKKTFITPEQKKKIRDKYSHGNQKIAEEYLHQSTPLFPAPRETPVWIRNDSELFEDALLLLGSMILEQEREIMRLKKTVHLRLKVYDACSSLWEKARHIIMNSPK